MEIELRPIVEAELPAYKRVDEYGFGARHDDPDRDSSWPDAELDRTVAAFEGGEIVGIGRNYSLELTLPGGAVVPAGGVSWIAVRPTHRRRGILRRVMTYLIEESARRGEPVSMLTATEGGIYGRFGYGVANQGMNIELERSRVELTEPVGRDRVRMVERKECAEVAPEVFDRMRVRRNGGVSRPASWWASAWAPSAKKERNRFDALYEVDGRVEGFVVYVIDPKWVNGFSASTVSVRDLIATTPDAEAALWQHLCNIDLTTRITNDVVPVDIELPWRLRDGRQMRTTAIEDWLWLRPLDVPALLGARRYAVDGRVVVEVHDALRPDGDAAGRFAVEGGPDGATCTRTDASPDLLLDVATLGSITGGTVAPSVLARAGLIEEMQPGALATADRMFDTVRSPFSFTWF